MSTDEVVEITGDLRLSSLPSDIGRVILPNLVTIGQDLYVADVSGDSGGYGYDGSAAIDVGLSCPSLVNVSGSVTFESVNYFAVDLPSLRNLGGSLSFSKIYMYDTLLSLPALTIVGGNLYFQFPSKGQIALRTKSPRKRCNAPT